MHFLRDRERLGAAAFYQRIQTARQEIRTVDESKIPSENETYFSVLVGMHFFYSALSKSGVHRILSSYEIQPGSAPFVRSVGA